MPVLKLKKKEPSKQPKKPKETQKEDTAKPTDGGKPKKIMSKRRLAMDAMKKGTSN